MSDQFYVAETIGDWCAVAGDTHEDAAEDYANAQEAHDGDAFMVLVKRGEHGEPVKFRIRASVQWRADEFGVWAAGPATHGEAR